MLHPGLFQRDLGIGQRQLLEIMRVVHERIIVALGHAGSDQVQQDLRILRIVLIPGVVHRFASACNSQRRDQLQVKALTEQEMGQGPMVVTSCLEHNVNLKLCDL